MNLISTEGLGLLGVGEDGSLYYNGKLIEVRQSLVLTGLQKTIAGLAVAFAILGGFGSMLQGAVAAHQWACQNEATAWRCPKK